MACWRRITAPVLWLWSDSAWIATFMGMDQPLLDSYRACFRLAPRRDHRRRQPHDAPRSAGGLRAIDRGVHDWRYTANVIVAAGLFLFAVATSPVRVVDDGCPSGEEVELALASMLTTSGADARQPGRGEARTRGRQAARRAGRPRRRRHRRAHARRRRLVRRARADGGHRDRQLGERRSPGVRAPAGRDRARRARPAAESPAAPPRPPPRTTSPPASRSVRPTRSPPAPRWAAPGFRAAWASGLWLLGAGDLARTIAVGTHEARWRRWTASLELARRWAAPRGS